MLFKRSLRQLFSKSIGSSSPTPREQLIIMYKDFEEKIVEVDARKFFFVHQKYTVSIIIKTPCKCKYVIQEDFKPDVYIENIVNL